MTIGLLTQALVAIFVRHDRAQFVDPGVALRRHEPELGQMRPQGVDDLGALAYQHIARATLHQLTLLFGRFDPHEAHGRSPNRFADRLGGPCSGGLAPSTHPRKSHLLPLVERLVEAH